MPVSKNIKSNVSTHVTKKPTKKITKPIDNGGSEESTIMIKKGTKKLLSDEINEILHNSENIKKSIDPESMDYFGDAAKVSKSFEDFGDIEDDNRGTRLKGDIPSEFTSGKYSGKKSSRKDNHMEEEDEVDQDNEYDIFGGDNNSEDKEDDDDSEDLDDAFDFQDGDDDEDEDDENVVVSSNIDRADMLFKKLQKQEKEEEKQPKLVGHTNEVDEMEKAQNTKNQTSLYNEFLTTRILLQRTVNCANKLPKPKIFKEFIELKDESLEKKFKEVKTASCLLVSELYNLQSELIDLNEEIPKSSSKKRIRSDLSLSEIWNIIEEQNQRLDQFHNQTITKWNNRISVASSINSGKGGNNTMKSLNQSILSQIQNTLNDFERLQKRTKLKRTTYRIIGEKQQLQQQQQQTLTNAIDQNEEEKDEYDDEIFDDTDFYQTLLKDLESNNNDENEVGSQYWIEMRNLKKKKKKKVNQKASKGRILRYEVFPKLENFMTPQPLPIPDWNIDQLYQNLFGGLGNVNIKLD
ncbi:hypothetical protein RB653_007225 [Dictyostelium firmibasis]|uniref:Protein bfr2 n=1 Tax=Dictyostelium firmibasis TaxID=79012 RepID=A0AAN7TU75_9MYCE